MVNKKHLHHVWRRLRPISYWYFLAGFVIFGVVGVVSLRQNNLNAIKLRELVNQVDKDNGDVEKALRELREYVYGHMNTNLATGTSLQQPVQLKYHYERLVAAEKERVATNNGKIYTDAQATCEKLHPASTSGGPRVPCIQDYVTSHGVKEQSIPDALYKFNFVSPRWSPDLAGFSLLASSIFLLLFLLRFITEKWMRHEFKKHL